MGGYLHHRQQRLSLELRQLFAMVSGAEVYP
jgi:hypothetical protein